MTIELTEKNKQELIQKGGTFFSMDITDKEYKTLCRKAEEFLANHIKSQFTNSINTNAINNLSNEQLNQVADILKGIK
tara:strand:+ start:872 stop:1105 length:234 start_codon:yes stop_codon:yes gene_type:complete